MFRNLTLFGALVLFLGYYQFWVQPLSKERPQILRNLDQELELLNERLISAQILANKLDRVYTLFESNLALSNRDSLAEDASLPFLNDLTQMLDKLDITVLSIHPKKAVKHRNYIQTPYELTVRAAFPQLGNLMAALERSPRLILVEQFEIRNGVEQLSSLFFGQRLDRHYIEMKISTLTLVKTRV